MSLHPVIIYKAELAKVAKDHIRTRQSRKCWPVLTRAMHEEWYIRNGIAARSNDTNAAFVASSWQEPAKSLHYVGTVCYFAGMGSGSILIE